MPEKKRSGPPSARHTLAALAALRSELDALPADALRVANTTGPRALRATLQLIALARGPARPAIEAYYKRMPPEVDVIETRALAFFAAVKQLEANTERRTVLARRAVELQRGRALRRAARRVLEVIAPTDRTVKRVLSQLDGGISRRAVAGDLAALHPQLVRLRDHLPRRGLFVDRNVDELGALVQPLLAPFALPLSIAQRELRDRAFTLLFNGFSEVEWHVRFALRDRVKVPRLAGRPL